MRGKANTCSEILVYWYAFADDRHKGVSASIDPFFYLNIRGMPKFVIERNIPDAGNFSPEKLRSISQKSREVLCKLGTDIQWIHSYVAGDKIYCIYIAPNEDLILEHAG
jgi:hypothetical protein